MPQSIVLPQAEPARECVRRARHHLGLACDLLDRPEPEFRGAAAHIEGSYREALAALATWHSVTLPEAADVREVAGYAVHFASILRTPARRALAALPVLRGVVGKGALSVHDREIVESAWYTARNLLRTVEGELPAAVLPAASAARAEPGRPRPERPSVAPSRPESVAAPTAG